MGIQLPPQNQGATRGRPLSHGEEKSIDRQLEDLEKQIEETEIVQGLSHQAHDKGAVQRRISELRRIRETRSVRRAVGREREAIEREVQSLTATLQEGMPSWTEYVGLRRRDGMRYIKLKNWILQTEQDQNRQRMILRWKYLRRRLDPDDPHAADMMNLFPQM